VAGTFTHGEMFARSVSLRSAQLLGYAKYRTPIKGLYLCGAGTHPGGGVTGMPGANAAKEIIKDLKSKRHE